MSIYNRIAGQRIARIEALSDGVFAIAMTILVFNLKDPLERRTQSDAELLLSLKNMLPAFLSFFLSFTTLGIFWTGQSTQFHYIKTYDRNLNWITLFFLMAVSVLPFTTDVLSHHINNKVSILLYWLNILLLGILIYIHWAYAERHHHLAKDEQIQAVAHAIKRRVIIAQALYGFGALLCFINTYISIAFIIAVQLNYAFGILNPKNRK